MLERFDLPLGLHQQAALSLDAVFKFNAKAQQALSFACEEAPVVPQRLPFFSKNVRPQHGLLRRLCAVFERDSLGFQPFRFREEFPQTAFLPILLQSSPPEQTLQAKGKALQ